MTREAVDKSGQGGVGADNSTEDDNLANRTHTSMFHTILKLYLLLAGVDVAGEGHDDEGNPRQQPAHIKEHEAAKERNCASVDSD